MDQSVIDFILFFASPIYLSISLAIYVLNMIKERDAIHDYKNADNYCYTVKIRKAQAVERIKSARKLKRESIIFPVPMVKGVISFFNNDEGEQILKKEDQRRAQVELEEAVKVIERARAEAAKERQREMDEFDAIVESITR